MRRECVIPKYKDLPDYILGCTAEIWEGRNIASLHSHYGKEIVVRTPAGITTGNKSAFDGTMATLVDFPDRQLLGEDVIWSGNEENGFLSSHRIISTATHSGNSGQFGPASGNKLRFRTIADTYVRDECIHDEWLIRDHGAIVRQLGFEPREMAQLQIDNKGGPENCGRPFTPAADIAGPYRGRGNDNAWGAKYADILSRIMDTEFSVIFAEYDRAVRLEYPGGQTSYGQQSAVEFWMGLRSAFPDSTFKIDHQIGRDDEMLSPRAALRWSLEGKHSGWGAFGPPTGAEVYVMGASHVEFGPYGIRHEFAIYDEVEVWKQILLHSE